MTTTPDYANPLPHDALLSSTIEDLNNFHDPTGKIREHLAQEMGTDSPRLLFDYVASKLYPEEVADLGENGTGQEMIFMNAVHMGLAVEGLEAFLGIQPTRASELEKKVRSQAKNIAKAIVKVGKSLDTTADPALLEKDDKLRLWIAVGRTLAAVGHYGQKRRNMKDYITHVEGAASIGREAWQKAVRYESVTTFYASQLVTYGHDIPEETADELLLYLANPKPPIMPLAIEYVARKLGEPANIARGIGRATMIMINAKDIEGRKTDYAAAPADKNARFTYITKLLTYGMQGEGPDLVTKVLAQKYSSWSKPFDNIQNLNDEGVREDKEWFYEQSLQQMEDSVASEADLRSSIKRGKSIGKGSKEKRLELESMPGFDADHAAKRVLKIYTRLTAQAHKHTKL